MPTVRVAIWNIQNFGSTAAKYTAAKGNNSAVLARFIAHVVSAYDLDVLMIQEVLETAGPSLVNVRDALNNGLATPWWCYDWIKGAFAADTPATAIQSSNDLVWNSGRSAGTRRAEGYAVFWRNDTAKFTMVPAEIPMSEGVSKDPNYNPAQALPANCLSLSRFGRDVETVQNRPQARTGFRPTNVQYADFDDAYYPDVSNMQRGSLYWGRVRRPAFCVLDLNNNGQEADRLCPIVSYHAPSNRLISNWGTYISGLAEQLYLTQRLDGHGRPVANDYIYHGKVIAGGDFNLTPTIRTRTRESRYNWGRYYASFWRPFGATWPGGANCGSLTTADARSDTTVQLNESVNGLPIGDPIMGNQMGDYLSQPIDNIFGRNLPNVRYELGALLREVMLGTLMGDPIKVYASHLDRIRRTSRRVDRDLGPLGPDRKPIFSFMQDWRAFIQGVRRGYFLDWRPAAEFVHGLVSDHMPVIAEMSW